MSAFPNSHAWEQQEWNKTKYITEKEGKRGMSMERSRAGMKEKGSPNGLNCPNQNTILINIIC